MQHVVFHCFSLFVRCVRRRLPAAADRAGARFRKFLLACGAGGRCRALLRPVPGRRGSGFGPLLGEPRLRDPFGWGVRLAHHAEELLLGEDPDPELLGLLQLGGPHLLAGNEVVHVARHGRQVPSAVELDELLHLVAAAREAPRDDETPPGKRLGGQLAGRLLELQAGLVQPPDDPQVLRVGEVVDDGIGDLAAHLVGFDQLFARGVHHGIQRAEVCRQVFGRGFPDESDAQGEQYPLKRNLDRAPDAPDDVLG